MAPKRKIKCKFCDWATSPFRGGTRRLENHISAHHFHQHEALVSGNPVPEEEPDDFAELAREWASKNPQ